MGIDEIALIDRYFRSLAGEGAFDLRDDAGRLDVPPHSDLVVTADMVAAGVHFLADDPPATIAQKALRVNLSDLAAKGARPLAYVLSAGFADDVEDAWLAAFAEGLRQDQAEFGVSLLGGDTISVRGGGVFAITAFGAAPRGRMVHRSGGRPGDLLYVSGTIGAAAAGLALLTRREGAWDGLAASERETLVSRYRVPQPRTQLAAAVAAHASAAIDVSDGLVGDCDKLAAASGCSATIAGERVPLPDGLRGDEAALATLLTGGDDYEILAAVPPEAEPAFRGTAAAAGIAVTQIGILTHGRDAVEVRMGERSLTLSERSFVHRRGGRGS